MPQSDPTPLAIACSLTAPEQHLRLREIAEIGQHAFLDAHVGGTRASVRFAAHDGIRERLEALVAAESSCCAFMTFDLRDDGGQLVLGIAVPEDAELVLEEFVGSFAPREGTS